ncbi:hypothetical protein CWI36_0888p0010 [Hamiltosporidium magnivora]|uniref:Uncharacterized protein n=1 Tax=Hamiltosporidium magnivora TaxID=148818 RepID=A0A4Q9L7K9_9MICR|nr:hypothetical protein CWI36_0888p0010 [Hamiltosporidium magnivora]
MQFSNLIWNACIFQYAYFINCADEQEEPLLEHMESENNHKDDHKYQIYSSIRNFSEVILKKRLHKHEHFIDKYHIHCKMNLNQIDTNSESIRITMNDQIYYSRNYVLAWKLDPQYNMSDFIAEMNHSIFICNEYIEAFEKTKHTILKMKFEGDIIYGKIGNIKSNVVFSLYLVQNLATLKNLKTFNRIIGGSSQKSKYKSFILILNERLNSYDRFVIFTEYFKDDGKNFDIGYISVMISQKYSENVLNDTVCYLKNLKKNRIDFSDLDNNPLEYTLYLNGIDILKQVKNEKIKIKESRNTFLGSKLISFFKNEQHNYINDFILPDLRIEIIEKPKHRKILKIKRKDTNNTEVIINIILSMYDYDRYEFVFIFNKNKTMIKSCINYFKNEKWQFKKKNDQNI